MGDPRGEQGTGGRGWTARGRVKAWVLENLEASDLPEGKEVSVGMEEVRGRTATAEVAARAWGGWRGLVDAEKLIKEIYEARLRPGRGPTSSSRVAGEVP